MFSLAKFPSDEKDEKIVMSLRRHGFTLIKILAKGLFFAVVPAGIYLLMQKTGSTADLFEGPVAYPLSVAGLSMYYLGLTLYIYNAFVDYYLDNWIITNHRIISIEEKNLFNRVISELKLYNVQDITAESKGIIPTIINYGTIFVQSAAEKERFVFHDVPRPFENARKIEELVSCDKQTHKGMI